MNIEKIPLIKNGTHITFQGDELFVCSTKPDSRNPKAFEYISSEKELNKKEHDPQKRFFLVKKEFLEYVEKYGLLNDHILNPDKKEFNVSTFFSKNIKEDINNDNFFIVKEIKNEHGIFAYSTEGNSICMGPVFLVEYYMTGIDDVNYKLDEFLENLSQRSDISLLCNMGRWEKDPVKPLTCPLKGNEPGVGKIIYDIEHHLEGNESSPAEKETFSLIFYPNEEQKKSILEFNIRDKDTRQPYIDRGIFNVEKYIVQDILGGEAFLNRPFIEEVPKRKFKN